MTAPAGEALHHWHAPEHWRAIDFVSDLHLSPALPRTLDAFVHWLGHTRADAVCLLGDVFELWVGDDSCTLPFEGRVTARLAAAAQRLPIHFMPGNRDFLIGDAMRAAAGLQPLGDPCCLHAWGRRWVLAHGDAQCLDDAEYQAFRRQVRDPDWQRSFLAQPLQSRLDTAQRMRAASRARRAGAVESVGDLDADACRMLLDGAGCTTLIHGHTHRPARHDLGQGCQRWVLSDWDLDDTQAPRAELLRLRHDGTLARLTPEQACTGA